MAKSKVYITRTINPDALVKIYNVLEINLPGRVAVKLHSGEKGNQNYLQPEFVDKLVKAVNGTVVECNTAYSGARDTTEKHQKLMRDHGWTEYFDVDIMDSEGEVKLDIPNGLQIKEDYVGKNIQNYDSIVVLSHFKGHPMGGFGGALKQLSIGCASSHGKLHIHCAGKEDIQPDMFKADQIEFINSMADAASAVAKYFGNNIIYINALVNLSVDCDCCAIAEDPCMEDIGILASTDPIAIDQACIDLIWNSTDPGKDHFIKRVESRQGRHILEAADKLHFGSRDYELVEIDLNSRSH